MTIKILAEGLFFGGAPLQAGTIRDFDATTEAQYVATGKAQYDPVPAFPGPRKSPYILAQKAVPVVLAPSGTWTSTDGALTLGTALTYVPSGVVQICLAASGIVAAGLYWATFSSTTACQVYTDAAGTQKPVTTAGAYTASTAEQTLVSVTVPGGAMGPNGALKVLTSVTPVSNGNSKIVRTRFDGQLVPPSAVTFSTNGGATLCMIRNRGVGSQVFSAAVGTASSTPSFGSVDTTVDRALTVTGQLSVPTDWIIYEGDTAEILPS